MKKKDFILIFIILLIVVVSFGINHFTNAKSGKQIEIYVDNELYKTYDIDDEDEIKMALRARARIIGVNNRNLKDFTVNINNSINLRKLVPEDSIFIAESGIKTSEDIEKLRKANVNAVLIGETLMRSKDKKTALEYLRGYKYE